MTQTLRANIASANINTTVMETPLNVERLKAAIDKAVDNGVDVLATQELVVSAYTGDGYFDWVNDENAQKFFIDIIKDLAEYANEKDPNFVLSVGFPFFYEDKDAEPMMNVGTEEKPFLIDNPLYNNLDGRARPFNAVATVSGGEIHAISAKSRQPDGTAEYEPRQFLLWPDSLGTEEIELYDGTKLPFGKPVIQIGEGDKALTMFHEICAEGWPGIAGDGTVNEKEMKSQRYLSRLSDTNDISLVLNPSGSKPEPGKHKDHARAILCETGSKMTGGAYVYTNVLGNENGQLAFEGGSIFARDGEVVHRAGERYSFADGTYSSAVMDLPIATKGKVDAVVPHTFANAKASLATVGQQADWEGFDDDKTREFEQYARNTALYLRDYLLKSEQQGFLISLSGGADSSFGAVMISLAIDLNLQMFEEQFGSKEGAVRGFIEQFSHLRYGDEVLKTLENEGYEAAVDCLKYNMLTCVSMPTHQNSSGTQNASDLLVNGDPKNGIKGIGGKLITVPVQGVVDSYIEAFVGLVPNELEPAELAQVRKEIQEMVKNERDSLSPEIARHVPNRIPQWPKGSQPANQREKQDDLTLQNIQARTRLPVAWLYGNDENKIACVTSNLSEICAGYWTFGGDGHMGALNPCGGIYKSDMRKMLFWLENEGVDGLPAVTSLKGVNGQTASAELRPLKEGEMAQFDEDDIMPYGQLDIICKTMINDRKNPIQTFEILKAKNDAGWLKFDDLKPNENRQRELPSGEKKTYQNGDKLFANDDELLASIEETCWRWHSSQFKRVAGVQAPFQGNNVDPHTAVRTTILSSGFKTERAKLKLEIATRSLGEEFVTEKLAKFGGTVDEIQTRISVDRGLRNALSGADIIDIKELLEKPDFGKSSQQSAWIQGAA